MMSGPTPPTGTPEACKFKTEIPLHKAKAYAYGNARLTPSEDTMPSAVDLSLYADEDDNLEAERDKLLFDTKNAKSVPLAQLPMPLVDSTFGSNMNNSAFVFRHPVTPINSDPMFGSPSTPTFESRSNSPAVFDNRCVTPSANLACEEATRRMNEKMAERPDRKLHAELLTSLSYEKNRELGRLIKRIERLQDSEDEFKTFASPSCGNPEIDEPSLMIECSFIGEVCTYLEFSRKTYHSAIAMLHYFLSKFQNLQLEHFQALGAAMVLIAAKIEETDLVTVENVAYWSERPEEDCNLMILFENHFMCGFDGSVPLTIVTTYEWFMMYHQLYAHSQISYNTSNMPIDDDVLRDMDIVIIESAFSRYSYSLLAAALFRKVCSGNDVCFSRCTGYKKSQVANVELLIEDFRIKWKVGSLMNGTDTMETDEPQEERPWNQPPLALTVDELLSHWNKEEA